jgi:hypothetical protein
VTAAHRATSHGYEAFPIVLVAEGVKTCGADDRRYKMISDS